MSFYDNLKDNAKEDQIERLVVGAIITNKNAEILLIKRNTSVEPAPAIYGT